MRYVKKNNGLLRKPARIIYNFISGQREYTVAEWIRFFKVSKSGYYEHIKQRESRKREEKELKVEIKLIFDESCGTYGPGRICGILRKNGRKASYNKVNGYMAEMGLSSIHNRFKKLRSLTDSKKARGTGYPNLLRDVSIEKPRQAVCGDITYLKSDEGWLYLCVVKDVFTSEILGVAMSESMRKELMIQAFLNAQERYNLGKDIIFHSDRGSQYTSKEFRDLLRKYGIRQSYSRIGMPGDNAWTESFFATLKKECVHFRHFGTREELRQAVIAWVDFYNMRRIQAKLGYMPPREYAARLMAENAAA